MIDFDYEVPYRAGIAIAAVFEYGRAAIAERVQPVLLPSVTRAAPAARPRGRRAVPGQSPIARRRAAARSASRGRASPDPPGGGGAPGHSVHTERNLTGRLASSPMPSPYFHHTSCISRRASPRSLTRNPLASNTCRSRVPSRHRTRVSRPAATAGPELARDAGAAGVFRLVEQAQSRAQVPALRQLAAPQWRNQSRRRPPACAGAEPRAGSRAPRARPRTAPTVWSQRPDRRARGGTAPRRGLARRAGRRRTSPSRQAQRPHARGAHHARRALPQVGQVTRMRAVATSPCSARVAPRAAPAPPRAASRPTRGCRPRSGTTCGPGARRAGGRRSSATTLRSAATAPSMRSYVESTPRFSSVAEVGALAPHTHRGRWRRPAHRDGWVASQLNVGGRLRGPCFAREGADDLARAVDWPRRWIAGRGAARDSGARSEVAMS